jgi:hypothetical protein
MSARTEYGAQLATSAPVVYVKDFTLAVVTAWIDTMAAVTPIRLVSRIWDGDTHGRWEVAP